VSRKKNVLGTKDRKPEEAKGDFFSLPGRGEGSRRHFEKGAPWVQKDVPSSPTGHRPQEGEDALRRNGDLVSKEGLGREELGGWKREGEKLARFVKKKSLILRRRP